MTLFMMIIGFLIVGAMIYLGVLPLLTERQQIVAAKRRYEHQYDVQDLQARYTQLLQSVIDLDADYDMAKVAEDVYAEQRKMLIGRSVYLRSLLDESTSTESLDDDSVIEEAILMRRKQREEQREQAIEAQIAAHRQKVTE